MILHDLRCTACDGIERDVAMRAGEFPRCPNCGGRRTWVPSKISTDMGPEFYCEATGRTHSRHRDAELEVAKQARDFTARTGIRWEPSSAGDKVHGARNETKIGSAFGFAGQTVRRSTAERTDSGTSRPSEKVAPAERADGPKRVTRERVEKMRRSPVYTGI